MDEIQPETVTERVEAPVSAQPTDDGVDPEVMRKRQEQALMFEKYLEESGLCLSFQIIFTEIIQK